MGKTGTDNPCDQASRDGGAAEAQMQSAQTRQAMETTAARARQWTQFPDKQKPDGEDTPTEADKENDDDGKQNEHDDDRKQNEHDDDTPRSEHAGSTQNSQPQLIVHIDKMQGSRTKTTTHLPEAANRASQRAKDPANPMRVQDILDKISIGPDLTGVQRMRVMDLVREYLDIFALSLSEVFPVNFTQHKLKIDAGIALPKKRIRNQ